jgi:ubiquinone/menaquinone biosynthesis C-methylase UbiE
MILAALAALFKGVRFVLHTNSLDVTRSTRDYWDVAADTYEEDFAETLIGKTRREAVWRELDRTFRPGQRVLELNCGTGIDASHLAQRGIRVLACDIAPRMIELARERVENVKCGSSVEFRVLATEDIGSVGEEGPFDGAFSNFSGLNCVDDLDSGFLKSYRSATKSCTCLASEVAATTVCQLLDFGRVICTLRTYDGVSLRRSG